MRQREPYRPQLQQPGSFRIENPAGDVNVSDSVAVEQNLVPLVIEQESENRNAGGKPCKQPNFGIPGRIDWRGFCFLRHEPGGVLRLKPTATCVVDYSRWVNSRKT